MKKFSDFLSAEGRVSSCIWLLRLLLESIFDKEMFPIQLVDWGWDLNIPKNLANLSSPNLTSPYVQVLENRCVFGYLGCYWSRYLMKRCFPSNLMIGDEI